MFSINIVLTSISTLLFSKSFLVLSNLEDEIPFKGIDLSHPEIPKFQDVNRKKKIKQ
jgi:hypothetical protein